MSTKKTWIIAFTGVMPNGPFFNGLCMCNMSFGALVLFVGFLTLGGLKMKHNIEQ